jgi:RNA polymerase sigma-B factor
MITKERAPARNYDDLAPLFRRLADPTLSTSEQSAVRQRLIVEHAPVAEHIAGRFRNRGQPMEDLEQVAAVGLIHAVDRFDPERGTDFLSFAVPTITGEVRRYFRDATWSMRVPRRLKELTAAIMSATTALGQRLGRAPKASELAAELGRPIEEIYEGLSASEAYRSDSLDVTFANGEDESLSAGERVGTEDGGLRSAEDRAALFPALAELPERERTIVVLRFFRDMTQTQIAKRLDISQMHVSRLLSASLATLRARLGESARDSLLGGSAGDVAETGQVG